MSEETLENETKDPNSDAEGSELDALAREIEKNPGGPSFPRLAEAYRRAGRVERAESIAKRGLAQAPDRMSGRVALALTMLDNGDVAQATRELSSILENVPELPNEAEEPVAAETTGSAFGEHRLYSQPLANAWDALPTLDGPGAWHTEGWVGAVLSGEEIVATEEAFREPVVRKFIDVSVGAALSLLAA